MLASIRSGVRVWNATRNSRRWTRQDELRRQFYGQFVGPGDLVFDVGANVGNRTKVFLKLGCRVVAFEPQASCVGTLRKLYARNGSFTLVEEALGSRPGRFRRHDWTQTQPVTVTTLDQAVSCHGLPRFIKIDVEGFELEALAGLSTPAPQGPKTQVSLAESMVVSLPEWAVLAVVRERLESLTRADRWVWGDVYIRCVH